MDEDKELAWEKLQRISRWLNWQDSNFNDEFKSITDIERCFDACERHSLEFADNLDWEDEEDEEYLLAQEVNEILGYKYYRV